MSHLQGTSRRKFGAGIPETAPVFIRRLIAGWHRQIDNGDGAAVLFAKPQPDGFIRSVQIGDAPWRWQARKVPARDRVETPRSSILFLPRNNSDNRLRRLQRIIEIPEIRQDFAVAVSAVFAQPRKNLVLFELFNVEEDRGKLRGVVARLQIRIEIIQQAMQMFRRKGHPGNQVSTFGVLPLLASGLTLLLVHGQDSRQNDTLSSGGDY